MLGGGYRRDKNLCVKKDFFVKLSLEDGIKSWKRRMGRRRRKKRKRKRWMTKKNREVRGEGEGGVDFEKEMFFFIKCFE